ncbi:hypothetical protein GCM10010399_24760 [Dactylosporangium fulvum]
MHMGRWRAVEGCTGLSSSDALRGAVAVGRVRDLRTGREHGDEGELIQACVCTAAGPVEIDV